MTHMNTVEYTIMNTVELRLNIMEKQKKAFQMSWLNALKENISRQSLKYWRIRFYKPARGRTVKTEDEVKIQLQIINSFVVVILVKSTGPSRTMVLCNSLFY